ncbi:unnamed protein product [Schistosoma mattheei]|uniref:Uncharacterized protein n=1 Tax=Schistosoma mattheei TaxID=31246 RepID=A0A3P8CXP6_9TREM|nr:unnamed protein product [Schistosoma mattheei]
MLVAIIQEMFLVEVSYLEIKEIENYTTELHRINVFPSFLTKVWQPDNLHNQQFWN